jgi:hypothetical protein
MEPNWGKKIQQIKSNVKRRVRINEEKRIMGDKECVDGNM